MTWSINQHIGKFVANDSKRTVTTQGEMTPDEIAEYKRLSEERKGVISRNAQRAMGLSSALGKDDRLFYLRQALEVGNVTNMQEAEWLVNVGPQTIKSYLKELGYTLARDKFTIIPIKEEAASEE